MKNIENAQEKFGVYWNESFVIDDYVYGNVKIKIGNEMYPKNNDEYDNYTLGIVFNSLKNSFINKYYFGGFTDGNFGETEFDSEKWHNGDLSDVFLLDTSELGGYENINTLYLCMAYSGNSERLFYSSDNGESFDEIRYPRGTIENIIKELPSY